MAIAIGFMYLCAALLLPLIAGTLWLLADGDRMRVGDALGQAGDVERLPGDAVRVAAA